MTERQIPDVNTKYAAGKSALEFMSCGRGQSFYYFSLSPEISITFRENEIVRLLFQLSRPSNNCRAMLCPDVSWVSPIRGAVKLARND